MPDNKRNNGEWTEARFQSFIKSSLRSASRRWGPIYTVIKEAATEPKTNVKTGRKAMHYICNCCKEELPRKEVEVNHISPVIPVTGFDSWDAVIERLFCEKEGLEVLCKPCHKIITKKENDERKNNRKQS